MYLIVNYQNLFYSMHAARLAHVILLDLIIPMIFGALCKTICNLNLTLNDLNKMGRTCVTHGKREIHARFLSENLKNRDSIRDLSVVACQ
jgi:hypothetical protein